MAKLRADPVKFTEEWIVHAGWEEAVQEGSTAIACISFNGWIIAITQVILQVTDELRIIRNAPIFLKKRPVFSMDNEKREYNWRY